MRILEKIKCRKKKTIKEQRSYDHPLLEIMRIVSFDDPNVLYQAENCVTDIKNYYIENQEAYKERGIDSDEDESLLQWIGCINILMDYQYVCECDWKEEKEDFLYQIARLKGMKKYGLNLNAEWLDERQSVSQWCERLEQKWKKEACVVAAFHIDSDSYVLFLCCLDILTKLTILAEDFGYHIDLARKM